MKRHVTTLLAAAFVIAAAPSAAAADAIDEDLAPIRARWAEITYHVPGDDNKEREYERLEAESASLERAYPGRAEPKIWHGIILSTHAGVHGGFGALKLVKRARSLFEAALEIDETALDGSAHTSLGSLYYQVPGWPLAFGDDDKAESHLERALAINPDGIDPNYFYADFLYEQGRYDEARRALARALEAPPRPGRELADAGRRQEARALLDKVRRESGS